MVGNQGGHCGAGLSLSIQTRGGHKGAEEELGEARRAEGRRPSLPWGPGMGVTRPPLDSVVGVPSPLLTLGTVKAPCCFHSVSSKGSQPLSTGPGEARRYTCSLALESLREVQDNTGDPDCRTGVRGRTWPCPRWLNGLGRKTAVLPVSSSVKCGQ